MPRFKRKPVDIVIDVRTRLEFFFGHLPGAIRIGGGAVVETLEAREDVTLDTRIMVYCASGARSAAAAAKLRQAGYRQVVDAGGMQQAQADFSFD